MKCELCEYEVSGEPSKPHGLAVFTNQQDGLPIGKPEEPFGAMFGIWNQRAKRRVDICGACLCERLGLVDRGPNDLRVTGGATSVRWQGIGSAVTINESSEPALILRSDLPKPKFREFL